MGPQASHKPLQQDNGSECRFCCGRVFRWQIWKTIYQVHDHPTQKHPRRHPCRHLTSVGTFSVPRMHAEAFAEACTKCIGTDTSKRNTTHYSLASAASLTSL